MLRLYRNFDSCEIGRKQFNAAGRPLEDSEREWVMRCNFVFKTISLIRVRAPARILFNLKYKIMSKYLVMTPNGTLVSQSDYNEFDRD